MESPREKKKYAFKTFSQKFSFCFSFVNYEKEKRFVELSDEKLKTNLKNHQTKEKQKEKTKVVFWERFISDSGAKLLPPNLHLGSRGKNIQATGCDFGGK